MEYDAIRCNTTSRVSWFEGVTEAVPAALDRDDVVPAVVGEVFDEDLQRDGGHGERGRWKRLGRGGEGEGGREEEVEKGKGGGNWVQSNPRHWSASATANRSE